MAEERPLRSFTDDKLAEDPLVVLRCGHAFPMSSMDSLLELDSFYSSTCSPAGARTWTQAMPLEVGRSSQVQFCALHMQSSPPILAARPEAH